VGFVRLRYFFGKRLGVADFADEQQYHAAKQRFHNRRLHGSGVLCGLGLALSAAAPTSLRVERGAALDRRGREVIVGSDQCIDVDAWLKAEIKSRHAVHPSDFWPTPALQGGWLRLVVVARYVECPTHPEPAPRDPCACSSDGGCDYGRVREGFKLDLVPEDEAGPLYPVEGGLYPRAVGAAASKALSGAGLRSGLGAAVSDGSDDAVADDSDGWLVLGSLRAKVESSGVTSLEILPATAPYLLSSAAEQELLMRVCAAEAEAGWMANDAPTITSLTLKTEAGSVLAFALALSGPIEASTFVPNNLVLRRLKPGVGWRSPAAGKITSVSYEPASPALVLRLRNDETPVFFEKDGLYRLALLGDPAAPVVDSQMRPLLPLRFSWSFKAAQDGTLFKPVAPFVP
jgi:hypothetical protein